MMCSTARELKQDTLLSKTRSYINGGAIIDHEAPRERRFVAVEK